MIACITSDRQLFIWESKHLKYRCVKKYRHDILQTGIWYMEQHKTWVAAGADFNIRTFSWKDNLDDVHEELICN